MCVCFRLLLLTVSTSAISIQPPVNSTIGTTLANVTLFNPTTNGYNTPEHFRIPLDLFTLYDNQLRDVVTNAVTKDNGACMP